MVIFPRIQKIKTFHDIPGVTNCSRTILFESRSVVDDFKFIQYDVKSGVDEKGNSWVKLNPTGKTTSMKMPRGAWMNRNDVWSLHSAYGVNSIFDLDYLNDIKMGIFDVPLSDIKFEVPIIIINRSEMIKTNHKTRSRELEITTNLYLGTCYLRFLSHGDSIKFDSNSTVTINNSHYVTIYKQLDDYGSSYINLENYSSFDHNPNHQKRERWVRNDQSKRINFFDPDPRYYNQEHQIKATGGNDESFIYRLLQTGQVGVAYTLGQLIDENTTIGRMYIKIEKLIDLAEKISAKGDSYFAPDVLIYQLYTLFAQVKYDLDGHCATSADVIMSTKNGWNVKNIKLGSDNLYKDAKLRSEIVKELMIAISGRYENFFKPFFAIGYDFDLYMHISVINNNMKVVFREAKGSTHIGLDGIIEDISTGPNTNERRGY